jgi:hypothetical protein
VSVTAHDAPIAAFVPAPLKRCRRRKCPGYARIWAGDQRRKIFANLDEYADQIPSGLKSRQVRVGAVTAPGSDQLDWDTNHCAGLGAHRHSGDLGCRVRHWEGSNWNRTAPARWRALNGEAYRRTVREGLKPSLSSESGRCRSAACSTSTPYLPTPPSWNGDPTAA